MGRIHVCGVFVGDAAGLDFLNSVATPVDTPVDWIEDGEGLLRLARPGTAGTGRGAQRIRARATSR